VPASQSYRKKGKIAQQLVEITEHDRFYWQYEYDVVAKYLLPLLQRWGLKFAGMRVLDIGCGDGGGLSALHDAGMICKGFDRDVRRVELAEAMRSGRGFELTVGEMSQTSRPYPTETFDLVVLHDVFEHLERKADVLESLKLYLNPHGKILITFPPFYSAFGGHQQLLKSKLGRLPFFHLLPLARSTILPRLSEEHRPFIDEIQRLGRLKLGIRSFEKLIRDAHLRIERKKMYLISPNHIRFGLRPLGAGIMASIPIVREFIVSGTVYLLSKP
jgi:2-polyprenyl-3-methyl-5-hydroxy-6-metoxy-1,4-benzoquinol methylase